METGQGRWMLALAATLVALVGLIVFVDEPDDDEPGMPVWEDAFPGVQGADVRRLTLSAADGAEVVLARDDLGWRIVAPIDAPADGEKVQAAATAVARASVGEPFARVDGAPYGLSPASITVVADTAAGAALTLALGDATPAGSGTYVRDADGRLRATRTPLAAALPLDPHAWRSKAVVQVPRAAARRVEITASDLDRQVLERDGEGWWLTRADGRHRASENAVDGLLQALNELRVERFVEGPLAGAAGTVIGVTAGEADPAVVVIGDGDGGTRVVQGPLLDGMAEAGVTGVLARLGPGALLATVLMPVHGPTLGAIDLTLGERRLVVTRDDAAWTDPRADAVVAALLAARVTRGPAAPSPDGPAWGHIELRGASSAVHRVTLYQPTDAGRVATDGGAPFVVPQGAIDALLQAIGPPT